jgi:hypothetical protein
MKSWSLRDDAVAFSNPKNQVRTPPAAISTFLGALSCHVHAKVQHLLLLSFQAATRALELQYVNCLSSY